MISDETERMFYHAVAVHTGGDYATIKRLRRDAESWRAAHEKRSTGERTATPEASWEKLKQQNIQLLLREDECFPSLLREIPYPPFGIYIKGVLPKPDQLAIAIVGTRRATPDGKSLARRFAAELARAEAAVISGLAFGIDSAAHEGCLEVCGTTIAVLACGLVEIYPRNNEPLAKKILACGGAIISEYPPEMPAYPSRFLERNRIVSGLSKGTLVIEAPERSGALATARFALEQNRDVFVTPGPVMHPNFKGSHALIRQGAELVTQPEDILMSYGVVKEKTAAVKYAGTPEEQIVLEFLAAQPEPADVDKLVAATKLEPRTANQALSFLLIKGAVTEIGAGYMIH